MENADEWSWKMHVEMSCSLGKPLSVFCTHLVDTKCCLFNAPR